MESWTPASRDQGLGGTDIAAILGLSPHRTRFDVYAQKRGLVEPFKADARMRLGTLLQPTVVSLFEEETGKKVEWFDKTIRNRKAPVVIGTPDGLVVDEEAGFEAKTAGFDQAWRWGDEGDHVPEEYLIQCQWYMLLTGRPLWYLGVLIGGDRFKDFTLKADEELQSMMLEEGQRFWSEHIVKGRQPDLDFSRSANAYLKKLYPSTVEKTVREPDPAELEQMRELSRVNEEIKFLGKRKDTLGNALKAAIGGGYGIAGYGLKAIWYDTKESSYTVTRPAGRTFKLTDKRRGGDEPAD